MKKLAITAAAFILFAASAFSRPFTFKEGDVLRYRLSYRVLGMSTTVADAEFIFSGTNFNGREAMNIANVNKVTGIFGKFFRPVDTIYSVVDPSAAKPLYFYRGDSQRENPLLEQYHYNWSSGTAEAIYLKNDGEYMSGSAALSETTCDYVTLIGSLIPTYDFEQMLVGHRLTIEIVTRIEVIPVELTFKGFSGDNMVFSAVPLKGKVMRECADAPMTVKIKKRPEQRLSVLEVPMKVGTLVVTARE